MKQLFFTFILIFCTRIIFAQVVIAPSGSSASPDPSAMLDIQSSNKGFLLPRMSAANRLSILNASNGLMVFDTDSNDVMIYANSNWIKLRNSNFWETDGTNISNSNTGYVGIGTAAPVTGFQVSSDRKVLFGDQYELGYGKKLLWDPVKGSLAFGYLLSTSANNDSIGDFSFEAGAGNRVLKSASSALGTYNRIENKNAAYFPGASFLMGDQNTIDASTSIGLGTNNTIRDAEHSFIAGWYNKIEHPTYFESYNAIIGLQNTSTSDRGIVLGSYNRLNRSSSILIGTDLVTTDQYSTVVGISNDSTHHSDPTASDSRLFEIGNGNPSARSNAITILKNGKIGLGSILDPKQNLELDGAIKIRDIDPSATIENGVIKYNNADGFQFRHDNVWSSLNTMNPFIINGNNVHLQNDTTGSLSIGGASTLPQTKMSILGTSSYPNGLYINPYNSSAAALTTSGRIGANTLSPDPTCALDVNGLIAIRGGSPAVGKVLTSDANGKASWQNPAQTVYNAGTGISISSNTISTNLVAGSGINISGNTISTTGNSGNGWTESSGNIFQNNPFTNSTVTVGSDVASIDSRMKINGNLNLPIGLSVRSGLTDPANGIAISTAGRVRVNANNAREDIETGGAIIVGGAAINPTPVEGTIQYAGADLLGYVGGQWKSLTAVGSGGSGSSPWTITGNDINNSNTGKILMGSATGTANAKVEIKDNTSNGKVVSVSNNGASYMTVLDIKETGTSGNPIGCDFCAGNAAIKASSNYGDVMYGTSNSRAMYVRGGDAFYPAVVIENNSPSTVSLDIAKQIQIRGGTPGVGKVLTSDANGLATWQTPAGGGGSGGSNGWNTTGNSGLSNTNFIGNSDAVDLNFRTNNINGLVLTSGGALLAAGSTSTGITPTLGAGSRMMWIPNRSAFRAGNVTGTHWNDIQIGIYSTAFGQNTIASGSSTFAVGNGSSATSFGSIAMGMNAASSGSYAVAIGNSVSAGNIGSFCLGDQELGNTLSSSNDNQMNMRFKNGYRLFTNSTSTIGVQIAAGGNSWATISDRRKKENFKALDGEIFLHKISTLPLSSWNYIGQDKKQFRHYGPMAQDFYAAFGNDGIGSIGNDTTIASADFDGVNLIAIQALEQRTSTLKKENEDLRSRNEALQIELDAMRKDLNYVLQMIKATPASEALNREIIVTANQEH